MGPEILILLVLMVVFFWWTTRAARKQQMMQIEEQQAALRLGNNVVTRAGFFGRIVDIDGDAVTLESPSGTETVWSRDAILRAQDIPIAEISEDDAAAQDALDQVNDLEDEAQASDVEVLEPGVEAIDGDGETKSAGPEAQK